MVLCPTCKRLLPAEELPDLPNDSWKDHADVAYLQNPAAGLEGYECCKLLLKGPFQAGDPTIRVAPDGVILLYGQDVSAAPVRPALRRNFKRVMVYLMGTRWAEDEDDSSDDGKCCRSGFGGWVSLIKDIGE